MSDSQSYAHREWSLNLLYYNATSSPDVKDSILTFFSVRILKRLVYSLVDLPQHHFFRGGCLVWWISRLFIIALDVLVHFVIVISVFICYKFEVASWCLPYGSSQSLPSKPALCGLVSAFTEWRGTICHSVPLPIIIRPQSRRGSKRDHSVSQVLKI